MDGWVCIDEDERVLHDVSLDVNGITTKSDNDLLTQTEIAIIQNENKSTTVSYNHSYHDSSNNVYSQNCSWFLISKIIQYYYILVCSNIKQSLNTWLR